MELPKSEEPPGWRRRKGGGSILYMTVLEAYYPNSKVPIIITIKMIIL